VVSAWFRADATALFEPMTLEVITPSPPV